MSFEDPLDWSQGGDEVRYAQCSRCSSTWYLPRENCARCAATDFDIHSSAGRGTVYACTTIERAPTPRLQQIAPYSLLLVDAQEGFRFMAMAASPLGLGEAVRVMIMEMADVRVPWATPA